MHKNLIIIYKYYMELAVDTMLNITHANISATFYECNTYLDNSSKYFCFNQKFE